MVLVGTVVRMARFPSGTPYVGPTMNYDEQIEPEQLLRRLVYGRPAPLLTRYTRTDHAFYGRLFDALANQHAVLVKEAPERTCRNLAAQMKQELPRSLYAIAVMEAPERNSWMLMVYNRIPPEARYPPMVDRAGEQWVSIREVARVLRVKDQQARNVVKASGIETRRTGGRNEIRVRRRDLVLLANRPRRWRRPRATTT